MANLKFGNEFEKHCNILINTVPFPKNIGQLSNKYPEDELIFIAPGRTLESNSRSRAMACFPAKRAAFAHRAVPANNSTMSTDGARSNCGQDIHEAMSTSRSTTWQAVAERGASRRALGSSPGHVYSKFIVL